jgi:ATP-dependent Lhr-like helicase
VRGAAASRARGRARSLVSHDAPLDVLSQQIVAESRREMAEDDLFALVRRRWPYRGLRARASTRSSDAARAASRRARAGAARSSTATKSRPPARRVAHGSSR